MQNGRNSFSGSQNCVNVLNKHSKMFEVGRDSKAKTLRKGEKDIFITNVNSFIILSESRKLNLVTSRQTQSK